MKIRMLVSVSRSSGFSARQGQELDIDAAVSAEMIRNGWAVAVGNASPRNDVASPADEKQADTLPGAIDLADDASDDGVSQSAALGAITAGAPLAQRRRKVE
jgi:hypothetical protein